MGLFNKKNKAPREIREDDSTFIKLWYNPRTHAIMVLGAYFVFFAIILIIVNALSTSSKDLYETVRGSDLSKEFDKLNSANIIYDYVIKTENNTYYFSGKKNNDGKAYGTILSSGESKNVLIADNTCYVGKYENDAFIEEESKCPEDIDYRYFNTNEIYNWVEKLQVKKYTKVNTYNFKVNEDLSYKIYIEDNYINKIESIDNKNKYELNYKFVETIDEDSENTEELIENNIE